MDKNQSILSTMENIIDIEIKTLAVVEAKAEAGTSVVSGYASIKNAKDSYSDVILNGAYTDLEESKTLGFTCINHDHASLPVGYITVLREDDRGLYFEAKFHSTKEAQDAYTVIKERMAEGLFVGMSIGYKTLKASYGDWEGDSVRFLEKIFVRELTFTLLPANDLATVTGVKSRQDEFDHVRGVIGAYVERIQSIKMLGRGKTWSDNAVAELDAIKADLTLLETAINELRNVEEKSTPAEEAEETDLGAESHLELARARAQAALAME